MFRILDEYLIYANEDLYCSFPSIETAPNGDLVCVFRSVSRSLMMLDLHQPSHHIPTANILITKSASNTKSFSKPKPIISGSQSVGLNDPGITHHKDKFYIRACALQIVPSIQRADIKGPLLSHRPDLGYCAGNLGNVLITCDTDKIETHECVAAAEAITDGLRGVYSRDPIVVLSDGSFGVSAYAGAPQEPDTCFFFKSFDNGVTWQDQSLIATGSRYKHFNETAIVPISENTIVSIIRCDETFEIDGNHIPVGGVGHIHLSISENAGLSWSTPTQSELWGQPIAAKLLNGEQILMVYAVRRPPYHLRLAILNGKTFKVEFDGRLPIDVCDHWDFGYPAITSVNADGRFDLAFYDQNENGTRIIRGMELQL